MERKTRIIYFFIATGIIFLILGAIWVIYDHVVIIPEQEDPLPYLGTYQFEYPYTVTNETSTNVLTLKIKLQLEPDFTAYLISGDGTRVIEHTKGTYRLDGNKLIYTRSYSSSGEKFDILFEPNGIPNEEQLEWNNGSLILKRSYFKDLDQTFPIVLQKQ